MKTSLNNDIMIMSKRLDKQKEDKRLDKQKEYQSSHILRLKNKLLFSIREQETAEIQTSRL